MPPSYTTLHGALEHSSKHYINMKKYITDFTIVEHKAFGLNYFALTLQHPDNLPEILPGQFVEVLVEGHHDVMLRRPISIHDVDIANNTLTLLIQIVGKGSRQLSTLREGDKLNLVYPLGHGFTIQGENVLLVGGGAGTAPLLYLAKAFASQGIKPNILLG